MMEIKIVFCIIHNHKILFDVSPFPILSPNYNRKLRGGMRLQTHFYFLIIITCSTQSSSCLLTSCHVMSCDILFLPIKFFVFYLLICVLHFAFLYSTHYSISHSLFSFSSRLNSKPHPLSHPYYHHFFTHHKYYYHYYSFHNFNCSKFNSNS